MWAGSSLRAGLGTIAHCGIEFLESREGRSHSRARHNPDTGPDSREGLMSLLHLLPFHSKTGIFSNSLLSQLMNDCVSVFTSVKWREPHVLTHLTGTF